MTVILFVCFFFYYYFALPHCNSVILFISKFIKWISSGFNNLSCFIHLLNQIVWIDTHQLPEFVTWLSSHIFFFFYSNEILLLYWHENKCKNWKSNWTENKVVSIVLHFFRSIDQIKKKIYNSIVFLSQIKFSNQIKKTGREEKKS